MKKLGFLRWRNLFLFLFLSILAYGVFSFYHQPTTVSHFFETTMKQFPNNNIRTIFYIMGEYKTEFADFVAGKEITVSLIMYFDSSMYKQIKYYGTSKLTPKLLLIENTENPSDSKKIYADRLKEITFDSAFVNKGYLEPVSFDDTKRIAKYQGTVIFTREGALKLGSPLDFILRTYDISNEAVSIKVAPRHVAHQIEANKRTELLAFLAVSIAFLSLYFAGRK